MAQQQVQQVVVVELEQGLHGLPVGWLQRFAVTLEKPAEDEIVFQQTPPRTPTDATQGGIVGGHGLWLHGLWLQAQTARRTIKSLILPMARVGLSPLGQTSTQFMMVWQRNRR